MQIGVESARAVDNRRIFIIHRDEIRRAAIQFMLHDENEAHELTDVASAFARAGERPVDLVILDIAILQADGIQVVYDLRTRWPQAAVLIAAERLDDPLAELCVARGVATGIIGTPLRIETVRFAVDKALGRRG